MKLIINKLILSVWFCRRGNKCQWHYSHLWFLPLFYSHQSFTKNVPVTESYTNRKCKFLRNLVSLMSSKVNSLSAQGDNLFIEWEGTYSIWGISWKLKNWACLGTCLIWSNLTLGHEPGTSGLFCVKVFNTIIALFWLSNRLHEYFFQNAIMPIDTSNKA